MYSNKMVCCLKANGKVLREFKDIVKIPFGSEYSLHFKNLHNKRAQVSVEIDGKDVLSGKSLVVNANSEATLSRYVNDISQGNTFKFIERTAGIEQHRGIKLDDGIIRITFKYEVDKVYIAPQNHITNWPNTPSHWQLQQLNTQGAIAHPQTLNRLYSKGIQGGTTLSATSMDWMDGEAERGFAQCSAANYSASVAMSVSSDVGITVPGSISSQRFQEVSNFATEDEEHVMILRLSGMIGEQQIVQPITVKTKTKCVTCGHQNKSNSKFCTECGTSLQII
jgi:hypothetical protein